MSVGTDLLKTMCLFQEALAKEKHQEQHIFQTLMALLLIQILLAMKILTICFQVMILYLAVDINSMRLIMEANTCPFHRIASVVLLTLILYLKADPIAPALSLINTT